MKPAWMMTTVLAAWLLAGQALAADCEADLRPKVEAALGATPSQASLQAFLAPLMAKPRYFETNCERPQLDHPLYPGIPVKQCVYEHLGLKGWVMLANPGPDLASKWIYNACADQKDIRTCAARLTAYTWCSNQLSYPVVGDIIEPASAGGGKGEQGTNFVFLHGVAIERPAWMPEHASVDVETQKKQLLALAAAEHAYKGAVSQVSRPSGIRREIHVKYALDSTKTQVPDVGKSCPVRARRPEWLDASRITYNQGWRTGKNPMFQAAAKALIANENPGKLDCGA